MKFRFPAARTSVEIQRSDTTHESFRALYSVPALPVLSNSSGAVNLYHPRDLSDEIVVASAMHPGAGAYCAMPGDRYLWSNVYLDQC